LMRFCFLAALPRGWLRAPIHGSGLRSHRDSKGSRNIRRNM
jgi:hypothetical protein